MIACAGLVLAMVGAAHDWPDELAFPFVATSSDGKHYARIVPTGDGRARVEVLVASSKGVDPMIWEGEAAFGYPAWVGRHGGTVFIMTVENEWGLLSDEVPVLECLSPGAVHPLSAGDMESALVAHGRPAGAMQLSGAPDWLRPGVLQIQLMDGWAVRLDESGSITECVPPADPGWSWDHASSWVMGMSGLLLAVGILWCISRCRRARMS